LPDIDIPKGEWSLRVKQVQIEVSATVSNLFVYGLPRAVAALALRKGDPVELEFDFLKREAVLGRKEGEARAE